MTYDEVHDAVKRLNGPASEWICDCGNKAKDWAFRHDIAAEILISPQGSPYSRDVSDYEPMCRRCHKRLDGNGWSPMPPSARPRRPGKDRENFYARRGKTPLG